MKGRSERVQNPRENEKRVINVGWSKYDVNLFNTRIRLDWALPF